MTTRESVLSAFAARVGPEVDRLFRAGHRAAQPRARPILQELGLRHLGLLADLRELLLAPEGVTIEQTCAKNRYFDRRNLLALLEGDVEQGLLTQRGEAFLPTEKGREVLLRLTDALAQAISQLWKAQEALLPAAVKMTGAVIGRAALILPVEEYPAFSAQRRAYVPPNAGAALSLFAHLAALRYLRADAHALAWSSARFDAVQAICLTHLREAPSAQEAQALPGGDDAPTAQRIAQALEGLERRGWVKRDDGNWELTPEGRAAREEIEGATNRHNALPFSALSASQRERLMEVLASLPDE